MVTAATRPRLERAPVAAAADLAIPAFDARTLARRAAIPAALIALAAAALVAAGGPVQAFADALSRAVQADPRWVAAGAGFELLSFAGYIGLLWLVAGRATPRVGLRESAVVTLGGAGATRLLPTAGAGGAALTLLALSRTGLGTRRAGRTLLTFLVLLYAVFLGAIAVSGTILALRGDGPMLLTVLPAAAATAAIVAALLIGVHGRRSLLGHAVRDALALLRAPDARLLGAVAYWAFDAAVLWAMLDAFGAAPALPVIVLAYFVGQVGNTLPVPGAVSGGIVGVLLAFGVEADLALVSVLGYRAVAIWLPAPLGLAALPRLRSTMRRWAADGAAA